MVVVALLLSVMLIIVAESVRPNSLKAAGFSAGIELRAVSNLLPTTDGLFISPLYNTFLISTVMSVYI